MIMFLKVAGALQVGFGVIHLLFSPSTTSAVCIGFGILAIGLAAIASLLGQLGQAIKRDLPKDED